MNGTQFENKSFTVPVGSPAISQEDWDQAFNKKQADVDLSVVEYLLLGTPMEGAKLRISGRTVVATLDWFSSHVIAKGDEDSIAKRIVESEAAR